METRDRDTGLDVVRSLAIVMVLVIHTASYGLTGAPGTFDWWSALLWGAPARPAVPLFFMCSGALMLEGEVSARRIFTHNLPRILCAMFFWALVYRLARLFSAGFTPAGLWQAVKDTLLFRHEFHFYYLHILLLVYAFLPVLGVFLRAASRRETEYLLALWAAGGILLPLLVNFWPFSRVSVLGTWYRLPMGYSAIGYALLGSYLRRYGPAVRRRWFALALLAGLGLTAGGCAWTSLRDGALNQAFLEGMSPGPMLMSLGLFGLIVSRTRWSGRTARAAGRLARASFCVYLTHILFLHLIIRLGFSPGDSPCLLSIPLFCLLLLLAGCLTWEVLHRIPIVNRYLV